MDMASLDFDSGGNLYVAFTFEDRVEKYGPDGKKLWTIKLLEGRRANKAKISSYVVPTEVVLKDIVLDRRGNVFVLGGHFSRNASRDVYVLSPQGEHRTTFTLPEPSHCLYIDSRNFLYSRANEGVTLKKYRLSYE
jgi:sugar lactone lactonase YvrE